MEVEKEEYSKMQFFDTRKYNIEYILCITLRGIKPTKRYVEESAMSMV